MPLFPLSDIVTSIPFFCDRIGFFKILKLSGANIVMQGRHKPLMQFLVAESLEARDSSAMQETSATDIARESSGP